MREKEGDRVATVITGQAEKKAVKTSSLVTGKQDRPVIGHPHSKLDEYEILILILRLILWESQYFHFHKMNYSRYPRMSPKSIYIFSLYNLRTQVTDVSQSLNYSKFTSYKLQKELPS